MADERHGIGGNGGEQRARRRDPVPCDHRRLAASGILAGRLAGGFGGSGDVEEIIGKLEGMAEQRTIVAEPPPLLFPGTAEHGAGFRREAEERAGLHRLHAGDRVAVEGGALGGEVERLAARHPAEAGGAGEHGDEGRADAAIGLEARQDVEGHGEQRVAGKDRGRLVEGAMQGRAAAAQVVVVHRRQVVVDEAVGVDAFERGGGLGNRRSGGAEEARGFDQDEGPETLAGGECRVAHGLAQPVRPGDLARERRRCEKPVEGGVGRVGGFRQPVVERVFHGARQ